MSLIIVLCVGPEHGDLAIVVPGCQKSSTGRKTLREHGHVEELQQQTHIKYSSLLNL